VWVSDRIVHGGLQSAFLVELNSVFFRLGTGGKEDGDLHCGVPLEWNRESFSVGYLPNFRVRS